MGGKCFGTGIGISFHATHHMIKNIFKDKYMLRKSLKISAIALVYFFNAVVIVYLFFEYNTIKDSTQQIVTDYAAIKETQENFSSNFSEELFEEHLKLIEKQKLRSDLSSVEIELEKLKDTEEGSFLDQINSIYDKYGDLQAKIKRNDSVKIDTSKTKESAEEFGTLLLEKDFEALETSIDENNLSLDDSYKKYLDSLPKPTVSTGSAQGYSYLTITTERGTTHGVYLIKVPLSSYRVRTIAAIENDCSDNCPTKTMQQYVTENNAYAGMVGSYACPADYAACAGKVYSFDYALYDSNDDKWFNKDALTWFDTGMFTFRGNSYEFYRKTSEYDGDSVDAAVSNFPSLLKNGEVVVDEDILTSYQKVRALRGAIGAGKENIYLAYITNATVTEAAYAMKSLGALHALNLDGGGTAAMYINGRYVVGPGRGVANAILLIK
ncbi:hypothetical protein C4561_00095 [candidate division WWE3 bacterium]|uniref:Phosphodiester glycosidase domain-containing protein n=1 Tax=candidate division WWE3 bacterium TaxID=2053526 RepID=A0A3A4ZGX6_UNCKA|nr:MAG: hypothetical protein C4561_00095 [candidate division WWE3 bacterium]